MNFVRFFCYWFFFLFILTESAFSQDQINIRRNYRPGETQRDQMVAQFYPFNSAVLDLSKFREKYPQYKNFVPAEVTIRPPDLTGYQDVVYSISYLEAPGETEGILLIYLIANYFGDEPVHFFDFNLDRNFTNDRNGQYIFPKKTEVQSFNFTRTGRNFRQFTIDILNPEYQVSTDPELEMMQQAGGGTPELQKVDYSALDSPSKDKGIPRKKHLLFLHFKTVIGFGGIHYSYVIPANGYPSRYNVEFNTKGLGAELSFAAGQLRLGFSSQIENLFYWSSKRYTQIQEPYTICENDRWGRLVCTNYDGVMEEINRETKPVNRYSFSALAEYDFLLSRRTRLTPYGETGLMHYTKDIFVPNRAYPDVNYTFGWFRTFGGGVRLKHVVSSQGQIVISAGFQHLAFDPKGFFDGVAELKNGQNQGVVTLGYQFGVL
ncbi:MAG: hypothetical protein R3C61_25210 [Bacteroidia bacterium]